MYNPLNILIHNTRVIIWINRMFFSKLEKDMEEDENIENYLVI